MGREVEGERGGEEGVIYAISDFVGFSLLRENGMVGRTRGGKPWKAAIRPL